MAVSKGTKKAPSKKAAPKSTTGAGQMVEIRTGFYKTISKSLSVGIISAGVALLGSAMSLYVAVNKDEVVKFVAVNEEGKIVKMVPLSKPNLTDEAVMQWTTKALIETFTFNAYDINFRLNESTSRYFTKQGAKALLDAMDKTGNFDVIVERGLFASIALEHAPLVVGTELIQNRFYSWNIVVPAVITYRSGTNTFTNKVNIELVVTRRSLLENESGLGIYKIVWTVVE